MPTHILIIDRDDMNRGLLRLVLEYDGCHCAEAANGAEGLSLLASNTFDVVIMKNATPEGTGVEFLLQHNAQNPQIPVIILAGLLNAEMRKNATRLGAYAIIETPYDFGELRATVARIAPSPTPHQHHVLMPR